MTAVYAAGITGKIDDNQSAGKFLSIEVLNDVVRQIQYLQLTVDVENADGTGENCFKIQAEEGLVICRQVSDVGRSE